MKLLNSLSNSLEDLTFDSKIIKWYTCGPTIYNKSHLGHARTFIIFDTIRNYLETTGVEIVYAMNITDIDDKILLKVIIKHWAKLIKKIWDTLKYPLFEESWKKINNLGNEADITLSNNEYFIKNLKFEHMEKWLLLQQFDEMDMEKMTPSYDDYKNFITEHENYFWDDMKSIGVKIPDLIMRVSDVIPNIISFTETLMEKGFAYESNGSVYFSVPEYESEYGKGLVDMCHENNLVSEDFVSEKHDPRDFALWKKAKKYEIYFESPWGKGRPGWHLECSVMINDMFGDKIDIHSGGIDLKFPHHNNEFLQTTSYTDNNKWVKYFYHSGHLHIGGDKMSQSSGNFVTIEDFLQRINYRVLKYAFLMHQWNQTMDFTEETTMHAMELDDRIKNFISHINYLERINNTKKNKYEESDEQYLELINNFRTNTKNHFENNFNTPAVINELRKIITLSYLYLDNDYILSIVVKAKDEIEKILKIFRINYETSSQNMDKKMISAVDAISEIRQKIRLFGQNIKKDSDIKQVKKEVFELSDWIRDKKLPEIGVKMEDLPDGTKYVFI
jgi:cysteinyl-tRNA synthetase